LGANVVGHNSERGPHKDHSTKVWSRLAKQFQKRRFFNSFFAEFSIFSNSGHLGWRPGSSNTILKGDHLMTIPPKFGPKWPSSIRGEDFYLIFLLNFIFLVVLMWSPFRIVSDNIGPQPRWPSLLKIIVSGDHDLHPRWLQ
jgi:hypothetical protein